ncbi:MAG: YaiO family outer membrane beta-barrel protein [Proteobacteria bacterium]|nr:YaiO family outer membrane beta-barrel protein [Pseudomonadota bacterium]
MRIACTAVLLSVLMPAHAESGPAIEWFQSGDRLSNGSPDWHSEELRLSNQIAARNQIDGTLRQTRRFGLSDTQIELNYAFPLAARLTGLVTASNSTTHRVLPRTDLGASLQYEFAPTWLLNVGTSRTEYDTASVNKMALGVEHYFSAFRWAAGWRPTRVEGVSANGGDVRFDYYYNDQDFVGIQVAAGKEASNIDTRGVVVSSVRSAALIGRHGLSRNWKLRYGIERVKQGDFYNRTGVRLGAQYAF